MNDQDKTQAMRTTVITVVLTITFVFLVTFLGCTGMLDDSQYQIEHAQAQQELKEDGAWVMW